MKQDFLRGLRRSRRLSLVQVWERTGIDPGQLSRCERNIIGASPRVRRALSRFYGVDEELISPQNKGERHHDLACDGASRRVTKSNEPTNLPKH